MKKKFKVLAAFSLLMFCMSSCVYSLFPIYTEDTLVFLPELVGKWQNGYDQDDYILFEKLKEEEVDNIEVRDEEPSTYIDSLSGNGWSIKSGDSISVVVNGKKITDRDQIIAYYDTLIGEGKKTNEFERGLKNFGNGLEKLSNAISKAEKRIEGTAYVTKEESYKMIVMDDGKRLVYIVHVVSIGKDYFLDLYPMLDYSDAGFGQNLFPVHTFMKMDITDGKLNLTMFDLEKLNKLFESNLIRLRHENVDGTILITAQPREIQKFLKKYADDESVYESIEKYSRVVE